MLEYRLWPPVFVDIVLVNMAQHLRVTVGSDVEEIMDKYVVDNIEMAFIQQVKKT